MEMCLDRLNPEDIPESERNFISAIMRSESLIQSVGFYSEMAIQSIISDYFKEYNKYGNIAICRTGSGGRFDGAGVGDQDFILITNQSTSSDDIAAEEILQLISKLTTEGNKSIDGFACSSVEHKCLSSGNETLLYHESRPNHPYPGRILESEFIAGSESLFLESKVSILNEVKINDRLLIKMKKELREYEKCCESGISKFKKEEVIQFTNSKYDGSSFVAYEPRKGIFGFKYAFLRFYQLAISIAIFQYMKDFDIAPEKLADLPQSVEERIRYSLRNNWVEDIDLAIMSGYIYARTSDIQTTIKSNYYLNSPENRDYEVQMMKGNSIKEMQDAVYAFRQGNIFKKAKCTK